MASSLREQMVNMIGSALADSSMTQAELSRRTGHSTKHINQVLLGNATASIEVLEYWAWTLDSHFDVALKKGR